MLHKISDHDLQGDWKDDRLDRKEFANKFIGLLEGLSQPFVIGLNSKYGTGKTFFIKRVADQINKKQDITNIRGCIFNAWQNDYTDNAFAAILSEIEDDLQIKDKHYARQLQETSAPILAAKTGKHIIVPILKVLIDGYTGTKAGSNLAESLKKLYEEVVKGASHEIMDQHKSCKKAVDDISKKLQAILKEEELDKLIIFVDDLDRCRPDYAIEVLECIKHFFHVPGLVFVLAIDIDQITESIRKIYGISDANEGYLRKFIDWQVNLPRASALTHTQALYDDFDFDGLNFFNNDDSDLLKSKNNFIRSFAISSEIFSLTPRQREQAFTEINLFLRLSCKNQPISFFIAFITCFKNSWIQNPMQKLNDNARNELIDVIDSYYNNNKEREKLISRETYRLYVSILSKNDNDIQNMSRNLNHHDTNQRAYNDREKTIGVYNWLSKLYGVPKTTHGEKLYNYVCSLSE